MHWKFLLFGITGNLAKIKILPGLSQFADLNQDKVSVELIGYSRSLPKMEEIELALNSGLTDILNVNFDNQNENQQIENGENSIVNSASFKPKKHNLTKVSFIQGSYADESVLINAVSELGKDERLVVYLAVPPSTFIKILENSCSFSQNLIDIIVEKPFGRDPVEAEKLLNIVNSCSLHSQVHFCDHYLFKNSTLLNPEQILQIQTFFGQKIQNKPNQNLEQNSAQNLIKIHIQILEKVDLKGRAGYFDSTGALKDMWPHLFSLLVLSMETVGFEDILQNFEDLGKVEIKEVFLGQYASYSDEEGLANSLTETYFRVRLEVENVEIILESGKNLPTKITQIELEIEPKTEPETENKGGEIKKLVWNIYPQEKLTLQSYLAKNPKLKKIEKFKPLENNDQIIELSKEKLDQSNLFESLLVENKKHFVRAEKIKSSWEIWQKIVDFIDLKEIKVKIYEDQKMPKIS